MTLRRSILAAGAVGAVLLLAGCPDSDTVRREPPPVPVLVATAEIADLPERIRGIGAVESISAVTLRPQISGQIEEIVAEEGRTVEVGQTVATIDARPFRAALREASANRDRLRALTADSERTAQLMSDALAKGGATQREVDTAMARAEAARAEVDAAEAAVETASLNLAYCEIKAPFSGRLGAVAVRRGSIVRANETPLMDLVQVAPIDVGFSIPEQHLQRVKAGIAASELPVLVTLPGSTETLTGRLWFVDNRIDDATGQVRLKARFDNEQARLWPGQFANVQLEVGVDRGVVLVPAKAVQRSQAGSYVFVLDAELRATMRPVSVRRTQDGVSVIESGLEGGETLVTEGQLRVVPGARVAVRGDAADQAARAANPAVRASSESTADAPKAAKP